MSNSIKGKRIINLIIDFGTIGIIYMLVNPLTSAFIYPGLLLWIVFLLYYFLTEILTGKTLGKRITKTKVVNCFGSKPKIGWMVIRTFLRCNPFDIVSYLFGNEHGTHDLLSKTKVVEE